MLLSIITPVYNTAKYLPACLDSLLDQGVSYDAYEIILINDGSTDDSPAILDDFAERYPNLRVVHKVNEGVSAARNIALDMARGEYIWFIDSDDFIERNVLPDIFEILRAESPEQLQMNMYHMKSDYFTPEEEALFISKKLTPGNRLICSAIIRAECINRHKIRFHPELTANGDMVFSYELKKSIGGYQRISTYEPIVYYYRKNGGSITYRPSAKKLNAWICLCGIMHGHALEGDEGFAEYTVVRYLYRTFHGLSQLPAGERKQWLRLMREKKVYPVLANRTGSVYYRAHYQTMGIKGIHPLVFRWIPTPIGYGYVMLRALASGALQQAKNIIKRKS